MSDELERLKKSGLKNQREWYYKNVSGMSLCWDYWSTSIGIVCKRSTKKIPTVYVWEFNKAKEKNTMFLTTPEIAFLKLREEIE